MEDAELQALTAKLEAAKAALEVSEAALHDNLIFDDDQMGTAWHKVKEALALLSAAPEKEKP